MTEILVKVLLSAEVPPLTPSVWGVANLVFIALVEQKEHSSFQKWITFPSPVAF